MQIILAGSLTVPTPPLRYLQSQVYVNERGYIKSTDHYTLYRSYLISITKAHPQHTSTVLRAYHPNLNGRRFNHSSCWCCWRDLLTLWECPTLRNTAVLGEVEIQSAIVPPGGQDQDDEREDRNGQEIQDTEEDEARGDLDLVSSVIHTVRDGVEQPDEDEPAGNEEVMVVDPGARGGDASGV
jgi:hypothetical protein